MKCITFHTELIAHHFCTLSEVETNETCFRERCMSKEQSRLNSAITIRVYEPDETGLWCGGSSVQDGEKEGQGHPP